MVTPPPNITAVIEKPNYVAACSLGLVCIISATVNCCMWIIICRKRDMRSHSNAFILCLSTADLLVAVVNMPVTVMTMAYGRRVFSDGMCMFMGLSNMLTFVTSVMSLCGISINRYVMVCMTHRYKSIFTTRNTALMITGLWLFSLLLSTPPLIGWGRYDYVEEAYFCFCDWKTSIYYAFFMIGTCFGIPFGVMIFCNYKILRTVKNSRKRVESVRVSSINMDKETVGAAEENSRKDSLVSCSVHDSGNNDIENIENVPSNNESNMHVSNTLCSTDTNTPVVTFGDHLTVPPVQRGTKKDKSINQKKSKDKHPDMRKKATSKRNKDEFHLTISLVIAICLFVVCWLPYCVSMVLSLFFPDINHGDVFDLLSIMLGYSNSCFNPIIYGVLNRKFRRGFRNIFCFWCNGNLTLSSST